MVRLEKVPFSKRPLSLPEKQRIPPIKTDGVKLAAYKFSPIAGYTWNMAHLPPSLVKYGCATSEVALDGYL